MARINLTDRFIKSRKAASPGKRAIYGDALVPGLALRVTDRGHKTFVLVARYPAQPIHPTPRALGDYGEISLDEARLKARDWLKLIKRGIDPRAEEESRRAAQQRRHANSFAAVAADYLEGPAKAFSKEADARATLEGEFAKRWGARPVTDITPLEVATAVKAIVARGAPYQAHNAFGYLRGMFNWAIGTGLYGLSSSPTERLRPQKLIGKREARERVLVDVELRQTWDAAQGLGYPYWPLVRMLILTGQRVSEVSDMSRPEIDLGKALWTIPAQRMKGGRAHEVPLAPEAVTLLKSLPRWSDGGFVFSTTEGAKPVNGFSKAKVRLDRLIAELRARERGGEGAKPTPKDVLPDWVFHDLRRTMRTHLSALPVQDLVRELVIAHAKPGLHKVYDQHSYQAEKREALELWEKRLMGIVRPAPAGVANIAAARLKRRPKAMS